MVDGPGQIRADIEVSLGADPGLRDVVGGNLDLQGAALLDAFEILPKPSPQVLAVEPDRLYHLAEKHLHLN